MPMVRIEDAVESAVRYIENQFEYQCDEEDRDIIYQDMEQKCWIQSSHDDHVRYLNDLIVDINPAEIASQIEMDNLGQWCKTIQVEMQMALMNIPVKEGG